jgi:hypothetical protein
MKTLLAYVIGFALDFIVFTVAGLLAEVGLKWGWGVHFPLFPVVFLASVADTLLGVGVKGLVIQAKRALSGGA